jgi:hypothetical protein
MSERTVIANQHRIMAKQRKIITNQERILAREGTITSNQKKLDKILANQKQILAAVKRTGRR